MARLHFIALSAQAIRIGRQLDAQCSRDAEIDLEVELGGTLQRWVAWACAAMIDNYRCNKRGSPLKSLCNLAG